MRREAYFNLFQGRSIEPKNRVGVRFLSPTKEELGKLVEEVVIHEEILPYLRVSWPFLSSEDFYLNQLMFSVPKGMTEGRTIMTPYSWGRSRPVGHGLVPCENGMVASTLSAKGVFRSGDRYSHPLIYREKTDPHGFFGLYDAQTEVDVAGVLLKYGYRSTMPLCTIILNNNRYEEFLYSKWSKEPDAYVRTQVMTNIGISLSSMKSRFNDDYSQTFDDQPVVIFRLGGVMERLDTVASGYIPNNPPFNRLKIVEMAWTAYGFLKAFDEDPDYYRDVFDSMGLRGWVLEGIFKRLARGRKIVEAEAKEVVRFYIGMVSKNAISLSKLSKDSRWGERFHYSKAGDMLGAGKDIGLDYISQDYEEVKFNTGYRAPLLREFLYKTFIALGAFFSGSFANSFVKFESSESYDTFQNWIVKEVFAIFREDDLLNAAMQAARE